MYTLRAAVSSAAVWFNDSSENCGRRVIYCHASALDRLLTWVRTDVGAFPSWMGGADKRRLGHMASAPFS